MPVEPVKQGSVDVGVAVSEEGSVTSAWGLLQAVTNDWIKPPLIQPTLGILTLPLDAAGRPIAGETVIRVRYELN